MRTSDNLGTENGEMPYILNSDSFTENIRLFRKHNDGNERSMQSTIGSPLVDTLHASPVHQLPSHNQGEGIMVNSTASYDTGVSMHPSTTQMLRKISRFENRS